VAALLAAQLDSLDADGTSALHVAIEHDRADICACILEVDSREALRRAPTGETTLHLAKSFAIAKMVLDVAPELSNAVDSEGRSVIDKLLASPSSQDDTSCEHLRLLLSAGAKPLAQLPDCLGEVSKALLEESLCGGVSAALKVAPWSVVSSASEDLRGWAGLPHGLSQRSVQCCQSLQGLACSSLGFGDAQDSLRKLGPAAKPSAPGGPHEPKLA